MITQERLKELLYYHPESGDFVWLSLASKQSRVQIGSQAGTPCTGYTRITVDGELYLAHRLAFLYMTGKFPEADADHKDTDRGNCCWDNLREATRSQNIVNTRPRRNSVLGVKGVSTSGNKFRADIKESKAKFRYLGTFDTVEAASAAFMAAARERHGEFART